MKPEIKKGAIRNFDNVIAAAKRKRLERFDLPGKVSFCDIDGILERHGHFLILEQKIYGQKIPLGQSITLNALAKLDNFTVIIFCTDNAGEILSWDVLSQNKKPSLTLERSEQELNEFIGRWYKEKSAA